MFYSFPTYFWDNWKDKQIELSLKNFNKQCYLFWTVNSKSQMINWILGKYMVIWWTWELCWWHFGLLLGLFLTPRNKTERFLSGLCFFLERMLEHVICQGFYNFTIKKIFERFNFKMAVFYFSFCFSGNLNYWRPELKCRTKEKGNVFVTL